MTKAICQYPLVSGVCSYCWNCVVRQKTERVGATKSKVWIGNFNVKTRKTIEHILLKIWHATQFGKISAKRTHTVSAYSHRRKRWVHLIKPHPTSNVATFEFALPRVNEPLLQWRIQKLCKNTAAFLTH